MHFDYNDTQQMLIDVADRFLSRSADVEAWRARRQLVSGIDEDNWAQFAELGWLAWPMSEESGGLGGAFEDVALLMISLGKVLLLEPIVSTAVLAVALLEGEPAKFRTELGAIAVGQLRLSLAHFERGRQGAPLCRARPAAQTLRINGSKILVLDAPSAAKLLVTATTEQEELLILLVDADAPGVHIDSYALIDGSRAADIRFVNVEIAEDGIVSRGEAAEALLAKALDRATVALLAQAVGSIEACVRLAGDYLKERQQFGQPIGKFQALQHLLVEMLVASHQSRSALYHSLANIEEIGSARSRAVSVAKIVVGDAMQCVSRTAIQLFGGYGLTDEYPVSHHFRRLLVLEKLFGDIDFHIERMVVDSSWVPRTVSS